MANIPMKDIQLPGLDDKYTFAQIDNTLTQTGQAADAKKTGDEITNLKESLSELDADLEAKINNAYITDTASGAVASFEDGADNVPVKELVAQIVPRQLGSGDPSPDNVREIVGWTGTGVHRAGVNLLGGELLVENAKRYIPSLDVNTDNKYIYFTAGASANDGIKGFSGYFSYKENTAYTLIITISKTTGIGSNLRVLYTDGTSDVVPGVSEVNQKETIVFVTNPNKTLFSLSKRNSSGGTTIYYNETGLFEGAHTIDEFVPYAGQTVDIDWSDEAGTVYGGSVDVTSGVLTVTEEGFQFVGESSENWTYGDSVISRNNPVRCRVSQTPIANHLKGVPPVADTSKLNAWEIALTSSSRTIAIKVDSSIQSVDDWLEYLSNHTLSIVLQLTNPNYATYQLDPVTIETLLGQNNIWAYCGDVEVKYRADTKLYIEKLTAPTEDDMVANANIPDATYFMIGNALYLSTTTIPAGDTINPGTNCTLMNLASALNALNS